MNKKMKYTIFAIVVTVLFISPSIVLGATYQKINACTVAGGFTFCNIIFYCAAGNYYTGTTSCSLGNPNFCSTGYCSTCGDCDGAGTCTPQTTSSGDEGYDCTGSCKYCSSGTCTDVACAHDTIDTTCSGSNYCNAGSCVATLAGGTACCGNDACTSDVCCGGDSKCKGVTNGCCSDSDCSTDVCSGSCPGCTYTDYSCNSGTKACGSTAQNPDDAQSYCTGCSQTWVSVGTGTNSPCCGDDSGEDWENAGAGSVCYNNAVLADGSSSSSILNSGGQAYDCNSQVTFGSGQDTESTTCAGPYSSLYCTNTNTWAAASSVYDYCSSVCSGGGYTYVTEGTGTNSKCCGDDSGEDFESSSGSGNSCCYNNAFFPDGSASGSIICSDGLLYDCNGAVSDDSGLSDHVSTGTYMEGRTCLSSNTWLSGLCVRSGEELRVNTSGASDADLDNLILRVGNETGAYNLCNSSSGQPERNCTFNAPWSGSGPQTIYGIVDDSDTGGASTEKTANITLDNSGPSPPNPSSNPSSWSMQTWCNISWTDVLDIGCSDTAKYFAQIDEGAWQDLGSALYWNTSDQATGNHSVGIKAQDSLGNNGTAGITYCPVDVTAPGTPSLSSPSSGVCTNDNTPLLSWSAATDEGSGVLYYHIQIDDDSGFGSTLCNNVTISSGTTSYETCSGLLDATTYYWHVRAQDNVNLNGSYSSAWNLTMDMAGPDVPTGLSPANDTNTSDNTPTFSWTAPSDNGCNGTIAHYGWFISSGSDCSMFEILQENITSDTSITAEMLNDGTYSWQVAAHDGLDNPGLFGPCTKITVDTAAPAVTFVPPTPNEGDRQTNNWIYVNVTAVDSYTNVDTCTLQWNGANETMTMVGSGLSVSCYKNKTTVDGTNYTYRVYANDTMNNPGDSGSRWNLENSVSSASSLYISPNPAYGGNGLNCSFLITDNQADTLTAYWNWWNGSVVYSSDSGSASNNTNKTVALGASIVRKGEQWKCEVRGYDGYENGSYVNSSALTISDTAPTQPNMSSIAPSTAYTDSNLTWNVSGSTDVDGDDITYECRVKDSDNSTVLGDWTSDNWFSCTTTGCDRGDTINVECHAVTSGANSTSEYRSRIISDTVPTQPTLTDISPATAYTDSNLSANASGSTDADGDTITYYYRWLDTNNVTVLQDWSDNNWFSCSTAGCDKGDTIILEAHANTTDANSSSEFRSRSIINSIPTTPTNLNINTTIFVGQSLVGVCSGSTDADDDAITYYYQFYNNNDTTTLQDWSADASYNISQTNAHDLLSVRCMANTTDANSTGYKETNITVSNSAPILAAIGSKTVLANDTLAFIISATDVDGDTIAYTKNETGIGTLDANTGAFSWTPGTTGTYGVRFTASDGTDSDFEDIVITVTTAFILNITEADGTPLIGTSVKVLVQGGDPTSPYDVLSSGVISDSETYFQYNFSGGEVRDLWWSSSVNGTNTTLRIYNLTFQGGTTKMRFFNDTQYTGTSPITGSIASFVSADDSSLSFDYYNITMPTYGLIANRIMHCTSFDFDTNECSSWTVYNIPGVDTEHADGSIATLGTNESGSNGSIVWYYATSFDGAGAGRALPDLMVNGSSIALTNTSEILKPTAVTFNVTVWNNGTAASAPSITVRCYVDNNFINQTTIQSIPSVNSDPNNQETVNCTWGTSTAGNHTFKVVIDEADIETEVSEANNEQTKAFRIYSYPQINSPYVNPVSGGWNVVFNFTANVTDEDGETLNMTLWFSHNGTDWSLLDSQLCTDCSTSKNVSFADNYFGCSDVDSTSFFKISITDNHIGSNESSSVQFEITTAAATTSVTITTGNGETVETAGLVTVNLAGGFLDGGVAMPSGVNGTVWISTNNTNTSWDSGWSCTSTADGNCTIIFDPTCDYNPGTQYFRVGMNNNACYSDTNSTTDGIIVIDQTGSGCEAEVSFQMNYAIGSKSDDTMKIGDSAAAAGTYTNSSITSGKYYVCSYDAATNNPTFGIVYSGGKFFYITYSENVTEYRMKMSQRAPDNKFVLPVTKDTCTAVSSAMPMDKLQRKPIAYTPAVGKNPVTVELDYPYIDITGDQSFGEGQVNLVLERKDTNGTPQIEVRKR